MKSILKTFLAACLCLMCINTFGQPVTLDPKRNWLFNGREMVDSAMANPQQWVGINRYRKEKQLIKQHYFFDDYLGGKNLGTRFDQHNKSELYQGIPDFDKPGYPSTCIIIDGTTSVEIIAQNIMPENGKNFRYRVVQNNERELVSWTTPSVFKKTEDGKFSYAYLGKFAYQPNQFLKVEIYNLKNFKDQDAIIYDWRKVTPAKIIFTVNFIQKRFITPDNSLMTASLTNLPDKEKTLVNGKYIERNRYPFLETTSLDDIKFRLGDSLQSMYLLPTNKKASYIYKMMLKRTIDGKTDSINLGENRVGAILYKELWKQPGKYVVTFTPKLIKHGGNPVKILRNLATSISFTVLPDLHHRYSLPLKTVAYIILIILTTGGFMFMMYRRGQKRKLAREAQDKKIATLQLASVRAQLNPHFIFNALAGIQNLMNKNEVENANKYLSRFARLTRNILDDGDKELTSIEHEVALLNDYLQMEQTRFGFNYTIDVATGIDQLMDIPAMLLQPFAENAVKHGVSALKDQGMITIGLAKQNTSLILTVQDNGKGFGASQQPGMGMKLCSDRIALLNSIYKNTSILLQQSSGSKGTVITIELKGWV